MKLSFRLTLLLTMIGYNFCFAGNVFDFAYHPAITASGAKLTYTAPAEFVIASCPDHLIIIPAATMSASNNTFSVFNPIMMIKDRDSFGSLISRVITTTFPVERKSPEEVAVYLSENLKGGTSAQFYSTIKYLECAIKSDSLGSITLGFLSESDASITIPGDFFKLVFSPTEGLQPGNSLSFKSLNTELNVTSSLFAAIGRKTDVKIPFSKEPLALSWGVNGQYKLGHIHLDLSSDRTDVIVRDDNTMSVHSDLTLETSGINVNFTNTDQQRSKSGIVNGFGGTIGGEAVLSNSRYLFAAGIDNLGIMIWNRAMRKEMVTISDDSLYLMDLFDTQFGKKTISHETTLKSLKYPTPAALRLKAGIFSNKVPSSKRIMRKISSSRAATVGLSQPLIKTRHSTLNPSLFFLLENTSFDGDVPIRFGCKFRNKNDYGSRIEIGKMSDKISLSLWYEARNDFLLRPFKGGAVGFTGFFYW